MPQRVDDALPAPVLVTVKESIRHCVALVTAFPVSDAWPLIVLSMDDVSELGPLMANVSKSSRN